MLSKRHQYLLLGGSSVLIVALIAQRGCGLTAC